MSLGVNVCIFAGYLGRDPELTYTQAGTPKVRFTIAITETWRNKAGEKQERTEWIACEAWRRTAELIGKHLHKGDPIHVQGKYRTREYEKDGKKERFRYIEVQRFDFLPKAQRTQDENRDWEPEYEEYSQEVEYSDDEVPF